MPEFVGKGGYLMLVVYNCQIKNNRIISIVPMAGSKKNCNIVLLYSGIEQQV